MKQSILTLVIALFAITAFSQTYTPPSYADIDNNLALVGISPRRCCAFGQQHN